MTERSQQLGRDARESVRLGVCRKQELCYEINSSLAVYLSLRCWFCVQQNRSPTDSLGLKIASQKPEACYAARVTELLVSFLPRRRRIVRGLI